MARDGSNGYDPDQLNGYLGEIDKADDELLKLKSEHMLSCKPVRAKIKNVMKQARNDGVNLEAFRAVIAKHRADRKVEQRMAELEADDLSDYQQMMASLGLLADTPLGEAALKRAAPAGETLDTLGA